ncbi:MAG: LytTR family DNA-binding domain-containing protein [Saprospiraceae bacterium]
MPISTVIIDDESGSRNNLRLLIERYCPEIEILGMAEDVPSGLKLINVLKPALIFLDIEMPGQDGFALIDQLPDKTNLKIIFTTAYEQYAIRAFKVSALDYLLKPIDIRELQAAVAKLKEDKQHIGERLDMLGETLKHGINKIAIPHQDGLVFVKLEDIVFLEAKRNYTNIYKQNDKPLLVAKSLREFEELLLQSGFFRTHRSFIINLSHVEEWVKKDGGYILMSNQKQVPIVKDRRDEFLMFYQAL